MNGRCRGTRFATRTLGAGLVVICAIGLLAAKSLAQQAVPPLSVTEIAPGVFVHVGDVEMMSAANDGAIADLGFVIGSEAVGVIDTGGSVREGRALLTAVRSRTDKPVRYVINTHMHPDHVFGNAAFEGAIFVGHHNLPRALADRADFYRDSFRRQLGDALMEDVKVVFPTVLITDEAWLDLGGRRLLVKAWGPAHTDNDVTVFDANTATLFAGDLMFVRHVPVLDGSLKGWLDVLAHMSASPAARVVPGHGPVPDDWHKSLADQTRYLKRLRDDLRDLIAHGVPMAPAARTAGQSERAFWDLFDDYNARNATAAYAELEWE